MNIEYDHRTEKFGSILVFIGFYSLSIPIIYLNIRAFVVFDLALDFQVAKFYYLLVHLQLLSFSWLSILLLIALSSRLKAINSCFLKGDLINMRIILIVQDKFCETIELVNKCFSIGFFMTLLEFILQCNLIVFSLCNIIVNISSPTDEMFVFEGCLHIMSHCCFVIGILVFTSSIKREGRKTAMLVHDLKLKKENFQKSLKFCQFASLQLNHRTCEISCGLFTIDWKFSFVMISSIFSYALILKQFDMSDTYKSLEVTMNKN